MWFGLEIDVVGLPPLTDLTAMSQSKQKTVERMTTYTAILASLFYVVTKQIG